MELRDLLEDGIYPGLRVEGAWKMRAVDVEVMQANIVAVRVQAIMQKARRERRRLPPRWPGI